MTSLLFVCIGSFLSIFFYVAARRWRHNPEVTLDDLRYRMLPVDRELLIEIEQDSRAWVSMLKDDDVRGEVRRALDDVKEHIYRISVNSERIRDCASYYLSTSEQQRCEDKLEEPEPEWEEQEPEAVFELQAFQAKVQALERTLEATANLRSMLWLVFFVIWLADMSAFHRRQWGWVPNIAKLQILDVLESYERVKMAAVRLAQACGEGAISQQLAETM